MTLTRDEATLLELEEGDEVLLTKSPECGSGVKMPPSDPLQIEREPNPAGDRVKISMSGKFLPFKRF